MNLIIIQDSGSVIWGSSLTTSEQLTMNDWLWVRFRASWLREI
ncbi:MAG: hypothetical protein ACJ0K4_12195 [Verrucomicrobiales bacterium]